MTHFIPSQYRNQKAVIISLAILLSIASCCYFATTTYTRMQVELEEHEQQLFLDQKNSRKLKGLRQQIKHQQQQLTRLDRSLLQGSDQDTITSTMQIQIQSMLTSSGLEPESLRPVGTRVANNDTMQSVVLKLRLSGTIDQFKTFLSALYKTDTFFQIEGLTIKPFKRDQLKIYMDLRGYYQTSSSKSTQKMRRK